MENTVEAQPAASSNGPEVAPETAWRTALRRRITPWIAAAADTIVPLAIGVAAVLIFSLLEQARDALFGALGSVTNREGRAPEIKGQELFWYYAAAAIMFGNLLWYTSRVMATTSIRDTVRVPGYARARRHYPRLLAYLLTSLLIAVAVSLAREQVMGRGAAMALAGISLLLPVVLVPLAQRKFRRSAAWAAWSIAITLAFESLLLALKQPEVAGLQTVMALALAATMPTVFYVLWVMRRPWLQMKGSADVLRAAHGPQMYVFMAGFVLFSAALAFAPAYVPRALGSPAIVLIALSSFLVGLVAVCLMLRTIEKRLPGLVAVGALASLAAAVLLRLAYQVEPWREVPGEEQVAAAPAAPLPAPPAPLAAAGGHDIVVNAHGGGLRAALFTASLLATLDDRSCGAFGARLTALSGVSGGSLGIATYLVARQRVMAGGGWKECKGTDRVRTLVDDALRRDHLSPVVARMLTVDLLPYITPLRGQALLDSWDTAIREAESHYPAPAAVHGLAMPLVRLDGGIAPAPLVFFNATDAATGEIFWMSNRGGRGREDEQQEGSHSLRLGEAILHSARFPVVSPVGRLMRGDKPPVLLVDGGLADVSGAFTLSRQVSGQRHWINIDGNFDAPSCDQDTPKRGLKTWSTLNALLELRGKQAKLAVGEMGSAPPAINAKLDFLQPGQAPDEQCAALAKMHLAPLGWYMSERSAEDMNGPIQRTVEHVCASLGDMCRPFPVATGPASSP